jgi:tetratricopeptide (TPR) repeat protein
VPVACGHTSHGSARPTAATPAAPPPVADDASAKAAYDAKHFTECARLFELLADKQPSPENAGKRVRAARCHALAGELAPAFASLDRALADGYHNVQELETRDDLVMLRADIRWPRAIETARANAAAYEQQMAAAVREPALRKELLARVEQDQEALMKAFVNVKTKGDPAAVAAADQVVAVNTTWLEGVVATYGWPGKTVVGEDASHAAWLLVQHADKAVALQKHCLAQMEKMMPSGEVDAQDYAYLYDRVAVAEKRPQRYGTQFDDHRKPQPIEDEAHVDARRAAIGLPSMAEYTQQMIKMYGPPT